MGALLSYSLSAVGRTPFVSRFQLEASFYALFERSASQKRQLGHWLVVFNELENLEMQSGSLTEFVSMQCKVDPSYSWLASYVNKSFVVHTSEIFVTTNKAYMDPDISQNPR